MYVHFQSSVPVRPAAVAHGCLSPAANLLPCPQQELNQLELFGLLGNRATWQRIPTSILQRAWLSVVGQQQQQGLDASAASAASSRKVGAPAAGAACSAAAVAEAAAAPLPGVPAPALSKGSTPDSSASAGEQAGAVPSWHMEHPSSRPPAAEGSSSNGDASGRSNGVHSCPGGACNASAEGGQLVGGDVSAGPAPALALADDVVLVAGEGRVACLDLPPPPLPGIRAVLQENPTVWESLRTQQVSVIPVAGRRSR